MIRNTSAAAMNPARTAVELRNEISAGAGFGGSIGIGTGTAGSASGSASTPG
jgi:hypothetical protein